MFVGSIVNFLVLRHITLKLSIGRFLLHKVKAIANPWYRNWIEGGANPGQQEISTSWALFILVALLLAALFTSYYLQLKKIQAVHESVVSIFAGMFVGLITSSTASFGGVNGGLFILPAHNGKQAAKYLLIAR